ncbi:MAG: PTS lactose/cellobiose transporter subunit IIA [Clostridia bacterium]
MEDLEMTCFEIITNVGSARSFYIEAIALAKQGKFDEADAAIKEGEEAFKAGHHAHVGLIQKEASGEPVQVSLILLHAEDQLMSAEGFKIVAVEFIELYKKLAK